ncbi:MAG: peptidase [Desulfuromonadaceae bacterium GWC2_58_13]|nr:MAG: peptidase [Desulfuromonadaceae bacterium GWC2_58_13]
MIIDFKHRQSAHCESGVTANLLSHYGLEMSEALAFGIGGGLFFAYLPFVKINDLPLTTFRYTTGAILKRTMDTLDIQVRTEKFRSPQKAMDELDRVLDRGIPVGLQTGAWFLPYFPPAYRFHFNMHNMVVMGRDNGDYLISDPVFPEPVRCDRTSLMKARFTKGALEPKGKMYYVTDVPDSFELQAAVKIGIGSTVKAMLKTPLPIVGIRGMRFLATRMERWPQKLGQEKAVLYLGQLVRMQEEIGTGGAGFRFIYAAFLQEAAALLGDTRLRKCSATLTAIGDRWRAFAVSAARNCKGRAKEQDTFAAMAAIIRDCAAREEALYKELAGIIR